MLAEMRQGFAAVSAAIAALSAGQAIPREQGATAVAPLFAPPAPAMPAPASRGTRRWARRPALAICAAVALALTLVGVIGVLIASVDDAAFGVCSLLGLLGLVMALVTLVWACVAALRQRRWGWAAALFFGTLALTFISVFTLPTLFILNLCRMGPRPSAPGDRPIARPDGTPTDGQRHRVRPTRHMAGPTRRRVCRGGSARPALSARRAASARAPSACAGSRSSGASGRQSRSRDSPTVGGAYGAADASHLPRSALSLFPAAGVASGEDTHGN